MPALALLLLLHLIAITWLVRLQTTHERSIDRLVTLLRFMAPIERLRARESLLLPAKQAPRPLIAPLPTIAIAPDNAVPAATSPVAGPGAGPDKLDLRIPKEFYTHPPPLTPAQEAMRDPRSNRLVLTKQEQLDVDFGVVECIAWQREPGGGIYRGPGHWQRIQGISTNPFTAHKPGTEDRHMECVR